MCRMVRDICPCYVDSDCLSLFRQPRTLIVCCGEPVGSGGELSLGRTLAGALDSNAGSVSIRWEGPFSLSTALTCRILTCDLLSSASVATAAMFAARWVVAVTMEAPGVASFFWCFVCRQAERWASIVGMRSPLVVTDSTWTEDPWLEL